MKFRFPESAIEEVLNSVDIVDVISEYLALKKSGSNYKALCPFHRERTPSFTVSPKKQMFYCFGCQTGGNVFSFIMKHENMNFPEAVKMMAEKAGIELPEVDAGESSESLSLLHLNKFAADYFHRCLVEEKIGEKARQYLSGRKISRDIIDLFNLGYVPSGTDVIEEMRKKGFSGKTIEESGLLSSNKKRLVFSQRVIFPIFNPGGKTIGFGARVLGNSEPKYINSPETPVYRKSESLYGLNLARQHIRDQGNAIVVEGYFDMICPFSCGIKNVVATLGTSLAEGQVNLLRRYTKEVVMLYDADTAGAKAALRSLDLFVKNGFRVHIGSLPQGEDPDSFLLNKGKEAFLEEIKKAKNLLDYKLEILAAKYDPLTVEGRVDIVSEMLPTISEIRNAVEKSEYVRKLSQCLLIDEDAVSMELSKIGSGKRKERTLQVNGIHNLMPLVVERTLLQLILEDSSVWEGVKDKIEPDDFCHSDYRHIVEVIRKIDSPEPARVMSSIQDDGPGRVVAELLVKPLHYTNMEEAVGDCLEKLKKQRLKRKRVEIQRQIAEKENEGDMEAVKMLLRECQKLIKESLDGKSR